MSAFLYFGVVLLTFLGSPSSASPRCPQHLPQTQLMKHHGEYCYQFVKEERQWDSARDYCWRHGGWLTTVNSEDLNRFIVHTLNHMQEWRNSGVWIGLHDIDTESQWKWVSSDPNKHNRLNWSNWNRGEPSDGAGGSSDCARMVRENHWRWSATSCSSVWRTYRFICQYNELPLITTTAEPGVEAGLKAELSPKNDSKSSAAVSDVDETTVPLQPRASNRNVQKTVHVDSNSVETDNSHEVNSAEQLVNEQGLVLSQVKQDTYSVQDAHANNTLLLLLVLCAVGFVCVTIVLAFILLRRRQKQQPKVSTIEGLANLSNGRIWRGPEGNDAARTPKRYTRCGSPAKAKCESSSKQTTSFMAVPTSEDTPTSHATGNDYIVNDYLVTQRGVGKKCVGEENAYLQPLEVCHSCGDECGGACAGAKSYGRDVADNLELTTEEHIYESIDEYEKRRSICADEENMNNERAIKA